LERKVGDPVPLAEYLVEDTGDWGVEAVLALVRRARVVDVVQVDDGGGEWLTMRSRSRATESSMPVPQSPMMTMRASLGMRQSITPYRSDPPPVVCKLLLRKWPL
jgi:hypothetical protein